jgi:hypothetical protein
VIVLLLLLQQEPYLYAKLCRLGLPCFLSH